MTNYISTPLSTLNADLNTIQTALSSKADKSEIPEVPEDLSSFTNSPGFATSAYVQEYVDEHGGASGDYLPLSGGNLSGRIYLKTGIPGSTETVEETSVLICSQSGTTNGYNWTISARWENQDFDSFWEDGTPSKDGIPGSFEIHFFVGESYDWTMQTNLLDPLGEGYGYEEDMDTEEEYHHYGFYIDKYPDTGEFYCSLQAHYQLKEWDDEAEDYVPTIDAEFDDTDIPMVHPTTTIVVPGTDTTDPFILSSDLTSAIGDINSVLDSINGEII